jgi:hypothetical protein
MSKLPEPDHPVPLPLKHLLFPFSAALLLVVSCGEKETIASSDPPAKTRRSTLAAPPSLTAEEQAVWNTNILAALNADDPAAIVEKWDKRGDTEINLELAARIHDAIVADFPDKALELMLYFPGSDNEETVRAAMYSLLERNPTVAENTMIGLRTPIRGRRENLASQMAQRIAADDLAHAIEFALNFSDARIYPEMLLLTVASGLKNYQVTELPALVDGLMKLQESPSVAMAPQTISPWIMAIAEESVYLAADAQDDETLDTLLNLRPELRDRLIGSSVIRKLDETDFDKAQEYAQRIADPINRTSALLRLGEILARDAPHQTVTWVESLPNPDDRADAYRGMARSLSFETPRTLTTFVRSIPTEANRHLFAKEYDAFLDEAELPDMENWKEALDVP